jgi:hypothetical protein
MSKPYLEITFRGGKALAAYLYLDRRAGDTVAESQPHGVVVLDFSADRRVIGVEILSPTATSMREVLGVLNSHAVKGVSAEELTPLAVLASNGAGG